MKLKFCRKLLLDVAASLPGIIMCGEMLQMFTLKTNQQHKFSVCTPFRWSKRKARNRRLITANHRRRPHTRNPDTNWQIAFSQSLHLLSPSTAQRLRRDESTRNHPKAQRNRRFQDCSPILWAGPTSELARLCRWRQHANLVSTSDILRDRLPAGSSRISRGLDSGISHSRLPSKRCQHVD